MLQALLPDADVAGSQAAFQLAGSTVGRAFATDDERTALVMVGSSAWVYGVPRPDVGQLLAAETFVGVLAGAVPTLDPRPAAPATPADRLRPRLVYEGSSVAASPGVPAPLTLRGFTAADEPTLRRSAGRWVLELWQPAWRAPFALGLFTTNGDLVSIGGPYALTDRYAEIAAWADPVAAGVGMVFAASQGLLAPMLDSGRRLSALVRVSNAPARRWANAAGWEVVAEQMTVAIGVRRPGLSRMRSETDIYSATT